MSTSDKSPPSGRGPDTERVWEDLFARAAPRPMPPEADAAEIRDAIYAEWDALTGRRVRLRRIGAGLAAALVLASVVLLSIDTGTRAVVPTIARVERVQGAVGAAVDGERDSILRVGQPVAEGAVVSTGNGQVALRLAGGGSLRLAPQTQLRLTSNSEAQLLAGALYFDSEGERDDAPQFTVLTENGTLRDVGTQFIVRVDSGTVELGVRDGRVTVARGDDLVGAGVGERLVVPQDSAIRRESIAVFGDEWAWAESLAPPFDVEGRYLIDFLRWVEGQTGRRVSFADSGAEAIAAETILRGSIDLEPMPKLTAVLTLTELGYSVDGERIVISTK